MENSESFGGQMYETIDSPSKFQLADDGGTGRQDTDKRWVEGSGSANQESAEFRPINDERRYEIEEGKDNIHGM